MEREAFPTLWPPTSYRKELTNGIAEYLVCVQEGEYVTVERKPGSLQRLFRRNKPSPPIQRRFLTGYLGLWYMGGEAHIVSIAVREAYRRRGLGELLLIGAIELGLARGAQVVTLEARVSNESAKALYAKYGFNEVGLRRRYYADNREDAAIMTTDSLTSDQHQALFDVEETNSKRGTVRLSVSIFSNANVWAIPPSCARKPHPRHEHPESSLMNPCGSRTGVRYNPATCFD